MEGEEAGDGWRYRPPNSPLYKEKGIGAQMCPAMFSGIATGDTSVSYRPNFLYP